MRVPTNNLRIFLIIPVAELSTINSIPSVSHVKGFLSEWLASVVNQFICKVGINLTCLRWRRPCQMKTFILSTLIKYSATNLIQSQIRPQIIGYIYTKSISPIDNIVLRIPYGVSGNSFTKTHKVSPGVAVHHNKRLWWQLPLLHPIFFSSLIQMLIRSLYLVKVMEIVPIL